MSCSLSASLWKSPPQSLLSREQINPCKEKKKEKKSCSTWLANKDERCFPNSPLFPSKPSLYLCCWCVSSKRHNLQRPLSFPLSDFFFFFPCNSWELWPFKEKPSHASPGCYCRARTLVCVCVCCFCLMLQWAAAEEWVYPPQPVCFGSLPLSDLNLVSKNVTNDTETSFSAALC